MPRISSSTSAPLHCDVPLPGSMLTTADGAVGAAAEREGGDVEPVPAQDRADLADDARLIAVADDDEGAIQRRLDLDTVEQHEARLLRLEHGALRPVLAAIRMQLDRDETREVARPGAVRLHDLQPALPGDRLGVHESDGRRQHRAEQPDQHRADEHVVVAVGELAVVADADYLDAILGKLGEQAAQSLGEPDIGLQPPELLRGDGREVDGVTHDAGTQELAHAGGRLETHELLRFPGRGRDMRRRHDLRQAGQLCRTGRLGVEDVESRAGDLSGTDRGRERGFVDQIAAGRIDDAHAALAAREPRRVEQAARAGRGGQVEADVVRLRAQPVQRDQLHVEVVRNLRGDVRIVRDDAHLERLRAPHDLAADAAQPEHAQALAPQLGAVQRLLLPAADLHRCVRTGDGSGKRQHERERVLGHADAVDARGIEHQDAAPAGGVEIDVVDARTGARDDAQARRGGKQVGVHLRRAADDQAVGGVEIRVQIVRRAAGARIDGPPLGAQQIGGRRRQRVGDDDLHGATWRGGAYSIMRRRLRDDRSRDSLPHHDGANC